MLEQHLTETARAALASLKLRLSVVEWDKAALSQAIKDTMAEHGLKMPQVAIPLRVAVLGVPQTPAIDAVLRGSTPDSCLIVSVEGRILGQQNPAVGLVPASNEKLVTTYVALQVLGAEARFTTQVETPTPPVAGVIDGNLSLIARLVGTPYLPSLAGVILFLEDVGESAYRIDALLSQLRLAGWLDQLGGLVLGGFTGFPEPDTDAPLFEALIATYFERAPYPVARGLRYGHFPDKIAVPIGIHARLTVTDATARLSLLEGAVDVSDSAPV